jgi:hemoglobin
MKKELQDEDDIRLLVRHFYDRVLKDPVLSPFFSHALENKWEKHLQVMDAFWSNVIFYTGNYTGNPLVTHRMMHQFKPLDKEKFDRWISLFNQTVDELYTGEKALLAKQRAGSIAAMMQLKILNHPAKEDDRNS